MVWKVYSLQAEGMEAMAGGPASLKDPGEAPYGRNMLSRTVAKTQTAPTSYMTLGNHRSLIIFSLQHYKMKITRPTLHGLSKGLSEITYICLYHRGWWRLWLLLLTKSLCSPVDFNTFKTRIFA